MSALTRPLGPGDRAPDFQLPVADREGTVRLADHLRSGPVLLSLRGEPGQAVPVFLTAGGFEMTSEDEAEFALDRQVVGYFLVGADGVIRWAREDEHMLGLPAPQDLARLV